MLVVGAKFDRTGVFLLLLFERALLLVPIRFWSAGDATEEVATLLASALVSCGCKKASAWACEKITASAWAWACA